VLGFAMSVGREANGENGAEVTAGRESRDCVGWVRPFRMRFMEEGV